MTDLRASVPLASWSSLLPPHRADGGDVPVGAPVLLDALPLAAGRWLALVADGRGRTHPVPLLASPDGVRRARPGDGVAAALVDLLGGGSRELGAFEVTSWAPTASTGDDERGVGVDQTNESVVVGGTAVVKWAAHAEQGPHPAPRLLEELVSHGFTGTPRPWGVVQWRPAPAEPPRLVASVVALVPGAVDGWTWVVDDLRDAVGPGGDAVVRRSGSRVGELVAAFHVALAGTARAATGDDTTRWAHDAEADLTRALETTTGRAHDQLVSAAPAVRAAWADGWDVRDATTSPVMRVHGDLHVGQVLRSAGPSYALTDFDGSPVTAVADRVRLQPAALDVAGMLQSLRHAALVLRRHEPEHDPEATRRATGSMCSAFLDAYRQGLVAAGRRGLLDDRLLAPLCLRQVCREFSYAATHLPRWSYVPEAALSALLAGPA